MELPQALQQAIDTPRRFEFSAILSKTFKVTHQRLGLYIMVGLMLLSFVLVLIGGAFGMGAWSMLQSAGPGSDPIALMKGIMIPTLIVALIAWFFMAPLPMGYGYAALQTMKGRLASLNDFFVGYASDKWLNLMFTSFLKILISFLLAAPAYYLAWDNFQQIFAAISDGEMDPFIAQNTMNSGMINLLSIPSMLFSYSTVWVIYIAWHYNVSGFKAIWANILLLKWNFVFILIGLLIIGVVAGGGIILLMIVAVILGVIAKPLGLLVGVVGGFLAVGYLAALAANFMYISFAERVGLLDEDKESDPEDNIIDHFMPDNNK